MRYLPVVLAGLWSLCLSPLTLAAQEAAPAHYRQGFWVEVAPGLGHVQLDCSGCGPLPHGPPWQSGGGLGWYAAAGVTPLPNLLVGGEVNAFIRMQDGGEAQVRPGVNDRDVYLWQVAITARYYPLAGSPLFVKAGAGLGGYMLEETNRYILPWTGDIFLRGPRTASDHQTLQTVAGALQAGIGYEVVVAEGVSLVPVANIVQLYTGNVEREFRDRTVTAPRNPRYVQLGLAVRIYPERMRYVDRPGLE